MSDEKEQKEKSDKEIAAPLKDYREEAKEKSIAKLESVRAVKALSGKDSQWTLTQELLQEIMANYTVINPDKLPPLTDMIEDVKKLVEKRYVDEPETKELILDSIPAMRSVREWVKKDGWDDAVWGKIKVDGLFTASKRAAVIESLRSRALDKSDVAAKIWLTLSGDYSEKMEVNDKSVDIYRDINKILHSKKQKE